MTRQRLLMTGLWMAIVGVTAFSGDADARGRCRNGGQGRGWRQNSNYGYGNNNYGYGNNNYGYGNNNYGYGSSNYGYGNSNGYAYGNGTTYGTQPAYTNTMTPEMQTPVQPGTTYSVARPTLDAAGQPAAPLTVAPQPAAPRAVINQTPINDGVAPVITPPAAQTNSSPDPDNEGRNASKIPGTAPTKAPAPAANATP
jgi:hypothetical protein